MTRGPSANSQTHGPSWGSGLTFSPLVAACLRIGADGDALALVAELVRVF